MTANEIDIPARRAYASGRSGRFEVSGTEPLRIAGLLVAEYPTKTRP
jgi:hypothetical protein